MNTAKPSSPYVLARTNFLELQDNSESGSGILVGIDETGGYMVQINWTVTQKEATSRQIFNLKDNKVESISVDLAKPNVASYFIYNAMIGWPQHRIYAVGNGMQTEKVGRALEIPALFSPIFIRTCCVQSEAQMIPLITGACLPLRTAKFELIRMRNTGDADHCDGSSNYTWSHIKPGFGQSMTTYAWDGKPTILPIPGSIKGIAESYFEALNRNSSTSVVVKFIDVKTGISEVEIINT